MVDKKSYKKYVLVCLLSCMWTLFVQCKMSIILNVFFKLFFIVLLPFALMGSVSDNELLYIWVGGSLKL